MFRQINIKNNEEDIKVYLYRNRREVLCEIPKEYIKKITRNLEEIDTVEIEIKKHIMRNGNKVINPIYNRIFPKQQIIVETTIGDEVKRERFTLLNKSRNNNKKSGVKKFTAYSFEHTLKTVRCEFPSTILQLKSDETHVAKGIMDVFEEQTGWKIGYVDPKSRTETMSVINSINYNLFDNFRKDNIVENGLIFDVNYTTSIQNDKALYLEIAYINLKTYSGETLLKTEEVINYITEPIAKNIKRIRAYHFSDTGNRYGVKYIFTTVDNVDVERITTFTNVVNKSITADSIKIRWEDGNLITKENVKYIQAETADDNYYDFLRDVQDQFNSLFVFDSYEKTISVIHRDNIGNKESNYMLSYDSNVLEIDIEEQSEYPNALKVMSGSVSISSENIYGGNIIYDFHWYKDNKIMSDELSTAYTKYEQLLTTKQEEWYRLRNNIMDVTQRKTAIDSEIKSLDYRIKYYKNLLVGFIAANDSSPQQEVIKSEIDSLESQLTASLAKRKEYEDQIASYEDEMLEISNEIKMENASINGAKIFTELDLAEYNDLLVYQVYNDEYYSTPYGLYNNAKLVLKDMLKPDINFDITTSNLCKIIRHPKGWNWILNLGDLFTIDDLETISEIGEDTIRLISYDYIPSDNKVSNLVFTNKIHKINNTNKMSNIGKQTANNSNTINNFKDLWEESQMQTNFVKNMIDGTLDATATAIRSRSSKVILDISDAGIFVSDATDTNKSLYLGCNTLAISEDGWRTSAVAINSNSVCADLVMGRLLLGQSLLITNDNMQFTIGLNEDGSRTGMHIKDTVMRDRIFLGLEKQSDGTQIAKLELKDKTGRSVVLDENGIISQSQFVVWDNLSTNFPMKIPYRSDEGVYSNKKIIMSLYLDKYRAFERGLSSGGSTQTSSASSSSSSGSGGYCADSTGSSSSTTTQNVNRATFYTQTDAADAVDNPENGTSTLHRHRYFYNTEPHAHDMQHYHSFEIPYHSHNIDHTHTLNTTHNHQLEYSIHEQDSLCSNVKVYINGEIVASGINSNIEIDITDKIRINQNNNIEVRTDTNGRITVNFFTKCFVGW